MNLKEIKWENVKEEILLTTEVNSEAAEVSEAKLAELNNWKAHNVYGEVEDMVNNVSLLDESLLKEILKEDLR